MLLLAHVLRHQHVFKIQYNGVRALSPWLFNRESSSCTHKGKHQIKYKPYVPLSLGDHDHKNMALRRPMSPHLTIYEPTLPSITSILQRITGIIVTVLALILTGGSLFMPNGIETYVGIIQSLDLSRPSVFIIKILLGAPFAFHYFNGIRFCAWNFGRWLSLKEVYSSATKSWIATAALTLLFAIL